MKDIDKCSRCRYTIEPECGRHCRTCVENAKDNYRPMRNADRIRQMSDSELLDFFCNFDLTMFNVFNVADIKEWLEREVEDD